MRNSRSTKAASACAMPAAKSCRWEFKPARRCTRTFASRPPIPAATVAARALTMPSTAWRRHWWASVNMSFPCNSPTPRALIFTQTAKMTGGDMGAAMLRLIANPNDLEASAIVSKDPTYHSMLRTTCVATRLDGGHANNALAQRAGANINCRMFPGDTIDNVLAQLVKAAADPSLTIAPTGEVQSHARCVRRSRHWSTVRPRPLRKNIFPACRCCRP